MKGVRSRGSSNPTLTTVLVFFFLHTSEDGAELLPAGDAALGGELPQCHLQEEDRQTSTKQEDEVRDEKGTCVKRRKEE